MYLDSFLKRSIEPDPHTHRNTHLCMQFENKNEERSKKKTPKIIRSEEVTQCITLLNGQLQSYTVHIC